MLFLDRRAWEAAAWRDGITVNGLVPCAPLFGVTALGSTDDTPSAPRNGEGGS